MDRRCASCFVLIFAAIWLGCVPARASNVERERYWAEQIVDHVTAAEVVWLSTGSPASVPTQFLGLYVPPEPRTAAGIIMVHGRGVHPAWGFIDSLRQDLAKTGWHTLSVQMPVLPMDAPLAAYGDTFPEAFTRIDAAIHYLQQQGVERVILLGHDTGALTVLAYGAERPRAPVAGIITIGAGAVPGRNRYLQPALSLQKIRTSILDLFGTRDLPEVLMSCDERAQAAKSAKNDAYRQVRVKSADHFFTDRYEALREHILAWLASQQARAVEGPDDAQAD
jgi:pimeloyl-ACP methyl ester carboxylesterase